ncbi:MAG: hypothetical protein U0414_08445 [Polyangiaceae bacterium]
MRETRILELLICLSLAGAACAPGGAADDAGTTGEGGGTSLTTTSSSTASASTTTASSSSSGAGGSGGGVEPPDFDSIPWETGPDVGFGVARKDTQNPLGENVFIGDAGYLITLEASEAWVRELYREHLAALGVRWVYAVQGPNQVLYSNYEIGNSHIAAALQAEVTASTEFVAVAAHSSGAYVAHELLGQLATGLDPSGVTDQKVLYFDLDGGQSGLSQASVSRLKHAYFVSAHDSSTGTDSPNKSSMQSGAATYPADATYAELDVSGSGCNPGAVWCIHMTLITTHPHDPADASGVADYSDFVDRPVTTAWLGLAGL